MSMGITQMNSLLSSQNTLESMTTLNATKTSMSGSARIMASEIEQDKGRGMDTAKKEEELADTEERIQSIGENLADNMTELNERLEADREKIREEEAEKARQAEKADVGKTEQSGEVSNSDPGVKVTTDPATGITEPVDVVEISPEAKAAAAANPVNTVRVSTATPQASTPSTGTVVDKKV